jgi:hypothetical protein
MLSEVSIICASTRLHYLNPAKLEYDKFISYANEPLCNLSFRHSEIGVHQVQGVDIFDSLRELRKILYEQYDVYLLCAGSRVDTYPSGASRNMTGGRVQFIYTLGRDPTRSDEVKIFDSATPSQVGSVEEQLGYHDEWLRSVNLI